MATEELLLNTLLSAQFELEFERAKQEAKHIYEDERARLLQVDLLLAEHHQEDLQEQIEQIQDVDLRESEDRADDLSSRLADLEEQYDATQAELKSCLRDIDTYQAEINSLNTVASGAKKVLTEKLSLTRELSTLKPELEHLRSQIAASDNILADKLSLQRELAGTRLELENSQRFMQRLKQQNSNDNVLTEELDHLKQQLAREKKQVQKLERQVAKHANERSAADAALVDELEGTRKELEEARQRTQQAERRIQEATKQQTATPQDDSILGDLRKELAKEKKTLHKTEREQLKKTTEWESQKESLETKLDAFRNKLRTTKEQLKEAQDELERREAAKFAESAAATKARMTGRATSLEPTQQHMNANANANPRKRNVARFDPDMTIGTPGDGGPAAKKRITMSSVGDKSTFSITPFLNRTMSQLPESPNAVMNETINELAAKAEQEETAKLEKEKEKAKKTNGVNAPSKKPVTTKTNGDVAAVEKKVKPLKEAGSRSNAVVKQPALASVVEEEGDAASSAATDQENATLSKTVEVSASTADTTSIFPKKKKLLGARKNIFDDGDETNGGKKNRGLGVLNLGLSKGKPRMLAEFSPLKKDRRGVMAGAVGA